MEAPIADKKPHVHREHGVERPDPFHWLKQRDQPEVLAYIEAENAYMEERAARFEGLHQRMFEEMKGYIQETDQSVAVERKGFFYYYRTVEGLSYPIHCRREGSMDAPEQVILDVNALAEGHDYTTVATIAISPDQKWLAYAIDHTGREIYQVLVLDLATGEIVDTIEATGGDVTWAGDNQTLFYDEIDETLRPWRIRRHLVGSDGVDPVVMEEDDPRFRLGTGRTRSNAWLVLGARSSKTSETWVIPADDPTAEPRCLVRRHDGMKYSIDHRGDTFFVRTNDADDEAGTHTDDAVNYKVMAMPVDGEGRDSWVEVIAHRPEVELASMIAFENHLVLLEREAGLLHVRVRDLRTNEDHRVSMPENAYDLGFGAEPELRHDPAAVRLRLAGHPDDLVHLRHGLARADGREGAAGPGRLRPPRSTGRSGSTRPRSMERWSRSAWSTRRDHPRDGTGKMLLYGYGSYGITIDAAFTSTRLVLLERGIAFAIAHPRGGGLLGRPWYENGKLEHKQHTFDDFIAAARHLQAQGWTSSDRMAIYGGSAGGMLMGAVLNQAPELFHAAVAAVPFVDVVSTMLDDTLPLTANEWEEWGNPNEVEASQADALVLRPTTT